MFSHEFYNVVHIVGIVLLAVALGGAAVRAADGGPLARPGMRRLVGALHGTGVLLILVGGFGMLARLGVMHGGGFPGWIWVKLGVWGTLAASLVIAYRRPSLATPLLIGIPLLAGLAAYMAIYKPI